MVGDPVYGNAAGSRIEPLGKRLDAILQVRVAVRRRAVVRRGGSS